MRVFLTTVVLAALVVLAAPSDAQAQAKVQTASGYGMAGCGLGSMVFGSQPGIVQILAGTTNSTFGSQTFGITSGTSNCVDSAQPVVSVSNFVKTNRGALARDMARGDGETIRALSNAAGCSDSTVVGKTLQRNFRRVFSSPGVTDDAVSSSVVEILQTDRTLACKKLVTAS